VLPNTSREMQEMAKEMLITVLIIKAKEMNYFSNLS